MALPTLTTLKSSSSLEMARFGVLAAPIGAVIASLLIILLIVWPRFSEVLRLRASNRELAIRVGSLEQKVDKLRSLDRSMLEEQLGSAEQLLPSDKAVFSLVSQIERSAGASGVLVNRIEVSPGALGEGAVDKQPAPTTPQKGNEDARIAPKVQLKVSLSSDYKSFLQFLNSLLAIPRVVTVHDLSIASASVAGQGAQVKTSLALDAYFKPLPKQLASIEAPVSDLTESESARLAQIKTTTGGAGVPTVPSVPLGRSDLFAPF